MTTKYHQTVMLEEAVRFLIGRKDGIYVDCTLGGGGHSRKILETIGPDGFLIGLDADAEAIGQAESELADFSNKILRRAFFDEIDVVLVEEDKYPVDGVLYDLGLSSRQIDVPGRGFTFQADAPLDMRFDVRQKRTAMDVVNQSDFNQLGRIIREYGEERRWRAITGEILRRRDAGPLRSTGDLAAAVKAVVGERRLTKSLARVFQAIRIEVNSELSRLRDSLEKSFRFLKKGGRLVVISFHSLEDRIVKEFMKEKALTCSCPPEFPVCVCGKVQELKILTRRVVRPSPAELAENPRARSAKLRASEKMSEFEGV